MLLLMMIDVDLSLSERREISILIGYSVSKTYDVIIYMFWFFGHLT
jgi:hypothetical protein